MYVSLYLLVYRKDMKSKCTSPTAFPSTLRLVRCLFIFSEVHYLRKTEKQGYRETSTIMQAGDAF